MQEVRDSSKECKDHRGKLAGLRPSIKDQQEMHRTPGGEGVGEERQVLGGKHDQHQTLGGEKDQHHTKKLCANTFRMGGALKATTAHLHTDLEM